LERVGRQRGGGDEASIADIPDVTNEPGFGEEEEVKGCVEEY
jgi:hypothetical protein